MKDFFKTVFAVLVALAFAGVLAMFLFAAIIGGLASLGEQRPAIAAGSMLVYDLSINISDAPPSSDGREILNQALGQRGPSVLPLRSVVQAIDRAATDRNITGIYLHGSAQEVFGYYSGFAALKEVREALERFKTSGKPIVAYLGVANTRDYYLASVADRVVMSPFSVLYSPGLASEQMFLAGAFQRYGIGIQVTRVGRYKSAVEPFTLEQFSPENREQLEQLLGDLWGTYVQAVESSRGIAAGELQRLVDANALVYPEMALQFGLVNEIGYLPDTLESLRELTKTPRGEETFRQVSLGSYVDAGRSPRPQRRISPNQVAVLYAEGAIVDGEGAASDVGGERFARQLRQLRDDDNVKAVVLRVNSPGGSAFASEMIQREMVLTREVKPVVVSMGTVAASGGYWISAYSDRVFAQPNTITGSIGVFGIIPNLQQLANDHGVTFDRVKTGEFADLFSISRPKTPAEMDQIQRAVDSIYEAFLTKVSEGRGLERSKVEELAQGRVWSGTDALALGLVDEIGGLSDAIAYAAKEASLDRFTVVDFPATRSFMEQLAESLAGGDRSPVLKSDPFTQFVRQASHDLQVLRSLNDPMGVYALMPLTLSIK
jgi:protease IV